jgi:hypothetical protein
LRAVHGGRNDYVCFVKSFAHGGAIYQLEYGLDAAKVALETCPDEDMRATMYWSITNKFHFVEEADNG